jgi:hypothetical protein
MNEYLMALHEAEKARMASQESQEVLDEHLKLSNEWKDEGEM